MPTVRSAESQLHLSPAERNERRRLIFHDTLALLTLTLIAICMGVLTYFFFNSFQKHRSVIEKRWFVRGQQAMAAGLPVEAVEDFRSALSFSSTNSQYQMALAEALAASGRTEEASAYFSTLLEAEPGNGFLNLQLARLAVRRNNPQQAIAYYQAALNGLWLAQGTQQRRDIRLELAKYMLSLGRANDAQGQLLAAEGNSLDRPSILFQIANMLRQADDPSDASTTYKRVERLRNAHPAEVLASMEAESQIAAAAGQYKRAFQALTRYMAKARQNPSAVSTAQRAIVQLQLDKYQRMLQLIPFDSLPPKQHDQRVLLAATIAHQRYQTCVAKLQPQNGASPNISATDAAALAALGTQWKQIHPRNAQSLGGDAPLQQSLITWTSQTEILTAKLCGAPTGDDALLLQLAQTPDKTE